MFIEYPPVKKLTAKKNVYHANLTHFLVKKSWIGHDLFWGIVKHTDIYFVKYITQLSECKNLVLFGKFLRNKGILSVLKEFSLLYFVYIFK